MTDLILEPSTKTPDIRFSFQSGILELKGRSIPEISSEFYKPLIDWVEIYSQQPQSETRMEVRLEYFNTSSSKSLLDVFKKLEDLHNLGKSKVSIRWYYIQEDESMEEAGQEYQLLLSLPFVLCEAAEL